MLEACAISHVGKVRSANQDAFRIVPELGLYLLADGMGGARGGERASQLAVEAVAENLARSPLRDAAALLNAVEDANQRILNESIRDPRLEGMGTTLVAVLETPKVQTRIPEAGECVAGEEELAIASVGDSRAYVLENGELRAITEDQTWIQEVGRSLGLDEAALKTHPMRHVLTMAVGVGVAVRIRYYAITLKPGALLMLCSDGLHGVVPTENIRRILNETDSTLESRCAQLIAAAHANGSPDNVTAVLIRALPSES